MIDWTWSGSSGSPGIGIDTTPVTVRDPAYWDGTAIRIDRLFNPNNAMGYLVDYRTRSGSWIRIAWKFNVPWIELNYEKYWL